MTYLEFIEKRLIEKKKKRIAPYLVVCQFKCHKCVQQGYIQLTNAIMASLQDLNSIYSISCQGQDNTIEKSYNNFILLYLFLISIIIPQA